jgi:hypothetical protein
MRMPPYDPGDLRPIADFVKEKRIPMKLRFLRKLCTKREFPSVWSGKGWHTTENAIRAYFWQKANREFRKLTS